MHGVKVTAVIGKDKQLVGLVAVVLLITGPGVYVWVVAGVYGWAVLAAVLSLLAGECPLGVEGERWVAHLWPLPLAKGYR